MSVLRVLIADDEPLARRALLQALSARPESLDVVECEGGKEAVQELSTLTFDIAYLDVAMPEVGGFEVLARLGSRRPRHVVFVTAFEEFAVRAFEVRALDYLLKPFTRARFDESFIRILAAHRADNPPTGQRTQTAHRAAQDLGTLRIKLGGRTVIVPCAAIVWVEAANSYVRVHTARETYLLRSSLAALESQLGSAHFLRVHRSALVQVACVLELRHLVRGDYELCMSNGDRVRASRRQRARLVRHLARLGAGSEQDD